MDVNKKALIFVGIVIIGISSLGVDFSDFYLKFEINQKARAAKTASVSSPYIYNFNQDGVVEEIGSLTQSRSPYWWVNSGGYMKIYSGRGHTNEGNLPSLDAWRLLYALTNPTDTDNGYHPQNIFRMSTKSKWQNALQQAYFIITKDNVSASPNRNASNGILFFNRYQDGNNLYYAGVRVDGAAVIKKKKNGVYTTLAYVKGVYPGAYNRSSSPNLLPKNKWIGLRSEVVNNPNGSVSIKFYIDRGWSGNWELVAQATDTNNPITQGGYGGIRTDFMDITFEDFRFTNL